MPLNPLIFYEQHVNIHSCAFVDIISHFFNAFDDLRTKIPHKHLSLLLSCESRPIDQCYPTFFLVCCTATSVKVNNFFFLLLVPSKKSALLTTILLEIIYNFQRLLLSLHLASSLIRQLILHEFQLLFRQS